MITIQLTNYQADVLCHVLRHAKQDPYNLGVKRTLEKLIDIVQDADPTKEP